MAGLAPEVGEEVFGGLPGQLQIDRIGTKLDFIIPSDLPAGADVDLGKEPLILPRRVARPSGSCMRPEAVIVPERGRARILCPCSHTCRKIIGTCAPPDGCSIAHSVFPIPRPSVLMHDSRDVDLVFLYLV